MQRVVYIQDMIRMLNFRRILRRESILDQRNRYVLGLGQSLRQVVEFLLVSGSPGTPA